MKLWFLRHGETAWNRERRLQGATAWTDLTPFGVMLAEATRDGMLAAGLRFERVVTSPYRRAAHTAEIVAAGFGCVPQVDARVAELAFGPYEGASISPGTFPDENLRACFENPPAYVPPPGAESFAAAEARLLDFLHEVGRGDGDILVVSHGGLMRVLLRYLKGLPLSAFWHGREPNCCVHVVVCERGRFTLCEEGRVFYDSRLASRVPSV